MLKAAILPLVAATLLLIPALLHSAVPGSSAPSPAALTSTPHSAAPDPAKVQAGQALFLNNCLPCHSVNEGQVGVGPSLYHELAKPHPKKTSEEVHTILKNGKGKMPPFGNRLSEQDVDNLVAYLHTV